MYNARYLSAAGFAFMILTGIIVPGAAAMQQTPLRDPSGMMKPSQRGEWIEQASGFPTASRGINYISIVDENISWAQGYDGRHPSDPCQNYTRTLDGGTTWTASTIPGVPELKFSMLYALDADTAWACMLAASSPGPQGIYKTSDGGSTWHYQAAAAFDPSTDVSYPDCVHFFDANTGWCLGDPRDGYFEIYTTNDSGANWTRVPSINIPEPLTDEYGVTGFYTAIGSTVWFGTSLGRLYKSVDQGHHWTVAQTTDRGFIKPAFRDADHGLVLDVNQDAIPLLSETSDGGTTWTDVLFTGACYDNSICYIPGTSNMYVSVGAATNASGAAYSFDGGHTWNDYAEFQNHTPSTQLLSVAFTTHKIGWAGSFNSNETTGGVWKHMTSEGPSPIFAIDVFDGKGLTLNVINAGDRNATNVSCAIRITGGLWIQQRAFTQTTPLLTPGGNFSFTEKVIGIGLGIIKSIPVPSIAITVTCSENVSAAKTAHAKIFLWNVMLQ